MLGKLEWDSNKESTEPEKERKQKEAHRKHSHTVLEWNLHSWSIWALRNTERCEWGNGKLFMHSSKQNSEGEVISSPSCTKLNSHDVVDWLNSQSMHKFIVKLRKIIIFSNISQAQVVSYNCYYSVQTPIISCCSY